MGAHCFQDISTQATSDHVEKTLKTVSLRSKRFLASSSRKVGREQTKKKERTGEGEGNAPALTFAQ